MTALDAKEYALSHLPCTMKGVTELFTMDMKHIILDKIVGMKPGGMGYQTLVFYFHYQKYVETSVLVTEQKVRDYLTWWLENKLNGVVGPTSNRGVPDQVWWVRLPIEIKEDRGWPSR